MMDSTTETESERAIYSHIGALSHRLSALEIEFRQFKQVVMTRLPQKVI